MHAGLGGREKLGETGGRKTSWEAEILILVKMVGPGLGQGQRGERRRGSRTIQAVTGVKDLEAGGNSNTV